MKPQKPRAYDNDWLGNQNVTVGAKLFKKGVCVATCMDTPNALAYAFKKTGAEHAESVFPGFGVTRHTPHSVGLDRVAAAGWLKQDAQAQLVRVKASKRAKAHVRKLR